MCTCTGSTRTTHSRPSLSFREWIYSTGKLVDQNDRSITNQGDGQGQLPLVPARQARGKLICLWQKTSMRQESMYVFLEWLRGDTFESTVEP
jgi:hypothetical protein